MSFPTPRDFATAMTLETLSKCLQLDVINSNKYRDHFVKAPIAFPAHASSIMLDVCNKMSEFPAYYHAASTGNQRCGKKSIYYTFYCRCKNCRLLIELPDGRHEMLPVKKGQTLKIWMSRSDVYATYIRLQRARMETYTVDAFDFTVMVNFEFSNRCCHPAEGTSIYCADINLILVNHEWFVLLTVNNSEVNGNQILPLRSCYVRKNSSFSSGDGQTVAQIRTERVKNLSDAYKLAGNYVNVPRCDAMRKRKSRTQRQKLGITWKEDNEPVDTWLTNCQYETKLKEMKRLGLDAFPDSIKGKRELNASTEALQSICYSISPFRVMLCSASVYCVFIVSTFCFCFSE